MAEGKPVGTMFAEISLDSTRLEQGLKKVQDSLTNNTIKVEDAYKQLGIKSDNVYEMMRANATASLDFIKNKTLSSKDEIIRAEAAAANRIRELTEEQYGKQKTLIESLKTNWVAASVAVAGAWAIIAKGIDAVELGATAMRTEESFRIVAQSAGESAEKIVAAMKKASNGTVDDTDIMQKAVKGMIAGLNGDQLVNIMEASRIAARVAGEDVKTAYENITEAISTGMPKALRKYLLITKEEYAQVQEALKAGVEDVDLYKIAMLNAAINAQKFGDVHEDMATKIAQARVTVNEFKEDVAKTWTIGIAAVIKGLGDWLSLSKQAIIDEQALNDTVINSRKEVAQYTKQQVLADSQDAEFEKKILIERMKAEKEALEAAKKVAAEREAAQKTAVESTRKAQIEIEAISLSAYEREMIRIDSEAEKFRASKVEEVVVQNFVGTSRQAVIAKSNEEIKKLNDKASEEAILANYKRLEEMKKAEGEALDQQVKMTQEARAAQAKSEEAFILANYERLKQQMEMEQKVVEEQAKHAAQRVKLERQMVKDIAEFTRDEGDLKRQSLEQEYKDRKKVAGDSVVLEKWKQIQLQKIYEEEVLRSGSFWEGMAVAYEQDLRNQKKWGERGAEIFNSVFGPNGALSSTLNTFFVDMFHGTLKTAEDYFNSFKDAVLAAIAKMVAEWLAFQAMVAAGSALGFGAGGTGSITGAAAQGIYGQAAGMAIKGGATSAYNYVAEALGLAPMASTATIAGAEAGAVGATSAAAASEAATLAAMEGGGIAYGASTTGTAASAGAVSASTAALTAGGMAAAVAAYIMIGQKYFGSAGKVMNPFKAYANTPEADLGLTTAAGFALGNAGWYWPGSRSGEAYYFGSIDYMSYPELAEMIGRLKDSWFDTSNLMKEFQAQMGYEPQPGVEDQRAALYYGWLASQPNFKAAVADLVPMIAKFPPEMLEAQLGAVREAGGGQTGMLISEPIIGIGLRTKGRYTFGEGGFPEAVLPLGDGNKVKMDGGGAGAGTIIIPVYLDGKEISRSTYKRSRRGEIMVHKRGIASI